MRVRVGTECRDGLSERTGDDLSSAQMDGVEMKLSQTAESRLVELLRRKVSLKWNLPRGPESGPVGAVHSVTTSGQG